jgi:putative sigma-54 modulation protein
MSTNTAPALRVSVTFRNTDSTAALKTYATEKIQHCVQKFNQQDTEVHVVLSVEKSRQIAEANFHTLGADFFAREESSDLYASIDSLCDSLTQQLRKHKDKLKSHH